MDSGLNDKNLRVFVTEALVRAGASVRAPCGAPSNLGLVFTSQVGSAERNPNSIATIGWQR